MATKREITESPVDQGPKEAIAWTIDFANWGTPTSPTVTLYAKSDTTTNLTAKMTGSAAVEGTIVTAPAIHSLTAGTGYVMVCAVTIDGNTMSAWCEINCEVI